MSEDEILQQIEAEDRARHQMIREMIVREQGAVRLAEFDAKIRKIELGITAAENCWHSLSNAQRRALIATEKNGGTLIRAGNAYWHSNGVYQIPAIRTPTVRILAAHELLSWNGGVFDPEAAAMLTERGLFVLKHGQQHSCPTCRK